MSYSVITDIRRMQTDTQLTGLTDDDDVGVYDENVINRAIADADALIDGYCMSGYTVPLSPVPDIIRSISVDITIYNLYKRRGIQDESVDISYERAVGFLRDVVAGKITLGVTTPAKATGVIANSRVSSDRIFSAGRSSDGSTGTLDGY